MPKRTLLCLTTRSNAVQVAAVALNYTPQRYYIAHQYHHHHRCRSLPCSRVAGEIIGIAIAIYRYDLVLFRSTLLPIPLTNYLILDMPPPSLRGRVRNRSGVVPRAWYSVRQRTWPWVGQRDDTSRILIIMFQGTRVLSARQAVSSTVSSPVDG